MTHTETATNVINLLAAALELGSNIGLDLAAVSSAIAAAQSQGRTLSADELAGFVVQWAEADAVESRAYRDRTSP